MEMSTWTPPVIQSRLPYPPQTVCSRPFCPTPKMGYDQQSVRLSNPHAFSEPISRSANLHPNWTPQMWNNGFHNQMLYKSPASGSNPPSHIIPHASLKAGQERTLTVNLNCDPPVLNTTYQRNYKDLHSMQSIRCTCSNTNCVFKNCSCRKGLIPPRHHPLNRHYGVHATHQPAAQSQEASLNAQINQTALTTIMNQGQTCVVGQHNETPSSVAHVPTASHIPVNSLQPSAFIINGCQKSQSQVQKPLCQPLPSREHNGYLELKQSSRKTPHLPNRHVNSAQVKQSLNRFVPILPKDSIQSQTTNISGHHSKTNFATFTAIPSRTHPQVLQSSTVSGMTANSQDITSISSSTSHTSSSTSGSGSAHYSHGLLVNLLVQNNDSQNSSSVVSHSAKSKSGSQQSTHDHTVRFITTAENYRQDKARQGQKQKEPAKESGISRGNAISHLADPQPPKQNERTNWTKRNDKMESCIDPAVSQKLVNSQLGPVQVNKVVAVFPPIYQQACSHGPQNDVTTSTNFRPVLKTNSAKNRFEESKNVEKETNVPNAINLPQVPSLPSSLPRLGAIAEMPTSDKDPTSGSQSCEITQCENDPLSTTQISNKRQDSVHSVDSTAKVSVEQSDVQQLESSSEDTVFDLSTVPVVEYTLQELKDLVNSLEAKPAERDKSMITDVVKSILDLFYNGDKKNLAHLVGLKDVFKSLSKLCVKEMHSLVLQSSVVLPKHIKMLEICPQTLTNETTIPSEGFKSSWLNVDGQPANVDNVLEEPISDSNLTWFKKVSQSVSESVVNVVDSVAQTGTDNPEDVCVNVPKDTKTTTDNIPEDHIRNPEHSSMIFPTADCKKDKMIVEKGCVRRTPTKLSGMQRISKKQFNQQIDDEIDTVKYNMQACNEQSLASGSNECVTNSDVFEEADVSDNTDDLPEIILLSSEEARKIFADCFERDKKTEPPQICHRKERKGLVTQNQSVNGKPQDEFKFTCSHMIGLGDGTDHFCPSCWNETPVLHFDEDETLLTPMEEVLNTDNQRQSLTPQSSKPIKHPSASVSPECGSMIASVISTQKPNGSDVMRDSNPEEQTQRSSPPTARDPQRGTAGTKNSNITMASSLIASRSMNSPLDDIKSPKTDGVPDAEDIRFSPDIVIKNIRTFKHPSDHRSTSRNGGQCSDDSKQSGNFPIRKTFADPLSLKTKVGSPAQMPRDSGTLKRKNALPHKQKRSIIMGQGHDGQRNQSKKLRLEIYGSKISNSNFHRERKLPSAPVYLTVSPSPNTDKNYTDEQSAKKKVYSQWSAAFIHPQKKSKKKHVEDHLKSKIQTLKIALKEKLMAI
ncbi:hypothetical protein Q7C36_014774 [Tachysurus vachellii]|uniref:Uncharacterized protein n=1 Tax=Tachysurus vachellii TaxID=175792 RepID=A0AA88SDK8_TACVA|nr:hypothetical protein Q7C36_014774 [Tachysurus vachellii]